MNNTNFDEYFIKLLLLFIINFIFSKWLIFISPTVLFERGQNGQPSWLAKQGWCGQTGENIPLGWSQSISTWINQYWSNLQFQFSQNMYGGHIAEFPQIIYDSSWLPILYFSYNYFHKVHVTCVHYINNYWKYR